MIKMSTIVEVFDEVGTPVEAVNPRETTVTKRQALRNALWKGKAHLLPKKCTEGFVDKAAEYVQWELPEVRKQPKHCLRMSLAYMRVL